MSFPSYTVAAIVISLATCSPTTRVSADETMRGGVTLNGIVLDAQDIPVSGATVMIWTAGVKQG